MARQILSTKLYLPPPRPKVVWRPRLIERLNGSLHRKLTLVSAPAGFGKTTVISEWIGKGDYPAAWLSLDEDDSDPARFLMYIISALQTIDATVGSDQINLLQSPQPPLIDTLLLPLLNEIASISHDFVLVL